MSANSEIGQEDIDKLLHDALSDITPDDSNAGGPQSQSDIDALLAAAGGDAVSEVSGPAEKPADTGGPQSQDDIDALLAAAMVDNNPDPEQTAQTQSDIDALLAGAGIDSASSEGKTAKNPADTGGAQSQDDIDALLAAAGADTVPQADSTAENPADTGGAQSQDDIDALLAAAGADTAPQADSTADNPADTGGAQSQDDIDALLAAAGADTAPQADSTADNPADTGGAQSQDDIDALLAAAGGDAAPQADSTADNPADTGGAQSQDDIDALLAAAGGDTAPQADSTAENPADTGGAQSQDDIDALLAAAGGDSDAESAAADAADSEMEALLNSAADADTGAGDDLDSMMNAAGAMADDLESGIAGKSAEDDLMTSGFDENSTAGQSAAAGTAFPEMPSPPAPAVAKMPPPPRPAPAAPSVPELSPEHLATLQDSLALSGSSGEVENLSGQISGLLGQLSEKSRRFQMAWLAAEQQARELRYQQTLAEHKLHVLASEKESARQEAELLRKQQSQSEGEKIAISEAHRTEIAALQLRIREQESRNQMLLSESNALKEELERARNEATGSDLEGRRARFDAERLNGELSSERQERQRLARALENREKELQAMQAQTAGHASTLFLDELHRLVRRLESELDVRGNAANEALSVFDRMEFSPEMQLHAATLRAALCAAAGLTPDESDALKRLDNESERPNNTPPLTPAPAPGEDSFVKALTRYDFARASGICSALMRAGTETPYGCMKDIHSLDALRHPEISDHLDDLAALLRGIKNLQEASDRSRGRENEHTEKVFVMMFDLLHTLVRLKLVSRATAAIWELFLELRGRFSFLTSDRQWKEYRDRVLSNQPRK